MVDPSDKGSSESEDMSSQTLEMETTSGGGGSSNNQVKSCADCGTTKTPLWRGGPAGPKSLCNACGIRSRKRRRALLGLTNKTSNDDKKVKENTINGEDQKIDDMSCGGKKSGKLGESMKRKIVALGDEVVLQRSTMDKFRKKLGEEEQAAVLLMALSCGSFYA